MWQILWRDPTALLWAFAFLLFILALARRPRNG